MSRPREFSPDQALEKAMHVFWYKGYRATSMIDLLEATNLNSGSLYFAFGGKRALFLKAMDHYCNKSGIGNRFSILSQTGPALPLITRFVDAILDSVLSDPQRRGCLITNTVVELSPHEKVIGKKLSRRIHMLEDTFFALLVRAKRAGELATDKDPRALARCLVMMMQGMIVMSKTGTSADEVKQAAKTMLSLLE